MGKRHVGPVVLWIVIVVSFLLLGAWIVTSASGYGFNPKTRRLQKTALIRVRSQPREATVLLNGKPVATRTPWEKKRLFPGSYEMRLEKPGYHAWVKHIDLAPSEARVFSDVVLFKEAGLIEAATEDEAQLIEQLVKPNDLYFQGGEIFTADRIITRLSRDVLFVNWQPNKNYVAYQVDGEIRVVEIDGGNDLKLADLQSNKPTVFFFSNNARYLVFRDGDQVRKLQVLD